MKKIFLAAVISCLFYSMTAAQVTELESWSLSQGAAVSQDRRVTDPETGQIGIASPNPEGSFSIEQLNYNFAEALGVGVQRSNDALFGIVQGIGKMFSGDISVRENLGGPVAIANVTREATERGGWLGFWNITAFLSVTLAIMNMLPIPALDGGHFMFLLYEGITRREPSPKVRMGLQQLGFILLIGLFILVTFNDILRTFGG